MRIVVNDLAGVDFVSSLMLPDTMEVQLSAKMGSLYVSRVNEFQVIEQKWIMTSSWIAPSRWQFRSYLQVKLDRSKYLGYSSSASRWRHQSKAKQH